MANLWGVNLTPLALKESTAVLRQSFMVVTCNSAARSRSRPTHCYYTQMSANLTYVLPVGASWPLRTPPPAGVSGFFSLQLLIPIGRLDVEG